MQQPDPVCHLIFFSFFQKHPDCSNHKEGYLSLKTLLKWEVKSTGKKCTVFIRDRQDPSLSLCHQKDTAVLTLPSCHTLCFSSSRTPGSANFLSIFHTLSHFLLQNSFTFSVTALISSLQFPFHFLFLRLQVCLTLTTSSFSTFPPFWLDRTVGQALQTQVSVTE